MRRVSGYCVPGFLRATLLICAMISCLTLSGCSKFDSSRKLNISIEYENVGIALPVENLSRNELAFLGGYASGDVHVLIFNMDLYTEKFATCSILSNKSEDIVDSYRKCMKIEVNKIFADNAPNENHQIYYLDDINFNPPFSQNVIYMNQVIGLSITDVSLYIVCLSDVKRGSELSSNDISDCLQGVIAK